MTLRLVDLHTKPTTETKIICQSNLEMSSSGNLEMSGLVGCYPQVHSSL